MKPRLLRVFFLLLVFSSGRVLGEELRIGFWNIRDLSVASRSEEELGKIAKVISNYDCLAICELNDTEALPALCKKLNAEFGKWTSTQTRTKVGNSPGSAEYYGYIYRADKLKPVGRVRTLREVTFPVGEATQRFDREPAVCGFRTLDRHFDFTMIVCHITWGKSVAARKGEIVALKSYYEQVQRGSRHDHDVILCGDFNRNVDDAGSLTKLLAIPSLLDTTLASTPTKIDTRNTYDHLLFQRTFTTEYTGLHGVYKFDETMFGNDDRAASKACSDHRPVWATFTVPERDDDP